MTDPNAEWPPERDAAQRLAVAQQALAEAQNSSWAQARERYGDGQVERFRAQNLSHLAARVAEAREWAYVTLAGPVPESSRPAAQRARAAILAMTGDDPQAAAQAADDLTRIWPAQDNARDQTAHDQTARFDAADGDRASTESDGAGGVDAGWWEGPPGGYTGGSVPVLEAAEQAANNLGLVGAEREEFVREFRQLDAEANADAWAVQSARDRADQSDGEPDRDGDGDTTYGAENHDDAEDDRAGRWSEEQAQEWLQRAFLDEPDPDYRPSMEPRDHNAGSRDRDNRARSDRGRQDDAGEDRCPERAAAGAGRADPIAAARVACAGLAAQVDVAQALDSAEEDRGAQLAAWHTDDHTTEDGAATAAGDGAGPESGRS